MRVFFLALSLLTANAAHAKTADVIMVDEDPPSPGLTMTLPGQQLPWYVSPSLTAQNRSAAIDVVRQMKMGVLPVDNVDYKIGLVSGLDDRQGFPTTWLSPLKANTNLLGCAASDVEDLGARAEREYFFARFNCGGINENPRLVYASVGVANGKVMIIYLTADRPIQSIVMDKPNG